jgi:hypothetical protein
MSKRVGYAPAITSQQTWGEWYNDHRLLLNPLVTGAIAGLLGVLDVWLVPFWWQTVAMVGSVAFAVFLWTIGLLKHGQRVFYRMVIVAGVLWFCALHTPYAAQYPLGFGVAYFCAVILLSCGYWNDQRVRKTHELDDELKMWPELAKRAGIPLALLSPKRRNASGYKRRLSWPPGVYTISQIEGLKEKIEGVLGIPHGQMRFVKVKDDADNTTGSSIDLVVSTDSAARRAPVPFTEPTMRSICDPMMVGPFEAPYDGNDDCSITWYEQGFGGTHTLAAGMTRSGKSGLYHLMLAETADCRDVVRWGIDAKGGMALRPWAPMFDWLVCGRSGAAKEEQAALLERLDAVMMYREEYAAEKGWDVWRVSRKHPLIILYVDEAAEVFGLSLENFSAIELIAKIGRMGAGVGVLLCAATQYPTVEAIASSQVQSQIGRRFCFRVERAQHQHVVLSKSATVDATFPDKPAGAKGAGWFYIQDQGVLSEIPARVRHVAHDMIFGIVEEYWDRKCELDLGSRSVSTRLDAYQARKRWTIEDIRQKSDVELWTDEADETDAGTDPLVVVAGNATGNQEGNDAGTQPGTDAGNETKEQAVDLPEGSTISIEDLLTPITATDADEFAKAQAEWNESQREWSTADATAEFWKVFQLAGRNGIRVGKLAELCHRSTSWVQNLRADAQISGAIVPVEGGFGFYRLSSIERVPTQYRIDKAAEGDAA